MSFRGAPVHSVVPTFLFSNLHLIKNTSCELPAVFEDLKQDKNDHDPSNMRLQILIYPSYYINLHFSVTVSVYFENLSAMLLLHAILYT